jgi:hypothetical protein
MVGSTHYSGWGERAGQLHAQNEGAPAGGLATVPETMNRNPTSRGRRLAPGPEERRRASVPLTVRTTVGVNSTGISSRRAFHTAYSLFGLTAHRHSLFRRFSFIGPL